MTTMASRPTRKPRTKRPTPQDIADAARAEDETLAERRLQALSLRCAGMTFTQIAQQQQLSVAVVVRDVERAKREVMRAPLEDIIATQRHVIHDLRRAAYPAALNPRDSEAQMRAHASIYKGLEQEAKLVGAYAPMRVMGVPSETEFAERFVTLVGLIKPETLQELARGHLALNATVEDQPEPVEAEVVAIPEPVVEPRDIDVAQLGQCRECQTAGCNGLHVLEQPDDVDDWANT